MGLLRPRYEIIGKFELLQAYGARCALCANNLHIQEMWVGHIISVVKGGQHTRDNVAPVHSTCERSWHVQDAPNRSSSKEARPQ